MSLPDLLRSCLECCGIEKLPFERDYLYFQGRADIGECRAGARERSVMPIFDIYGRFQIAVQKTDSGWAAYRKSGGLRAPYRDLVFPADLEESGLEQFLDDHFHEYAQPGQVVRRVISQKR
jgi:hypothetical protein